MSYWLLFPTITFAFSFECSVLPLVQSLKKKDPTGSRAYKACKCCLIIVMTCYIALIVQSVVYGELLYDKYLQNKDMYSNCTAFFAMGLSEFVAYSGQVVADDRHGLPNIFAILLQILFFI